MKTLSPLKASLFAILASTTVLATSVSAEPEKDMGRHHGDFHHKGERMGRDGMHRMFEGLDLTEAQKADIKKLFAEQRAVRKENRPPKEEREAMRKDMQEIVTASSFDEVKAKAWLDAQQEKRQSQMIEHLKMQNQIYNLLTPEQQTKFKARFEAQAEKEPQG
ncbi:Spy/CpxP family protein refolding chaperone [Shewanella acanthi]|uniref:Spy/CpxP family protein refolding chaperone n=1 Tax=Shewanella acanthi TaxID=2864212 RepID=UPI001C6591E4|nr:Spy/CpxP family protein refolding chaperone [Shewanella acanthi]QYJ80499.1 Spy/CpxP family protein refolding chaperone [Shewanella acanthi]